MRPDLSDRPAREVSREKPPARRIEITLRRAGFSDTETIERHREAFALLEGLRNEDPDVPHQRLPQ
jgi:hypothetical protein